MDDVNSDEVPTTGVRDSQQNIVLLSVNPRAGARSGTDRVDALEAELKSLGFITDRQTDIETVAQRARQYQEEGRLRSVVAAGGDGTVSLVLNNTPIGVPLAVLPLGTENLLARYFRLQMPVPKIAGLIQQGFTKTLDVGIANGRLFLLMVGVGFDAAVVEEVDRRRTGHIHKWSYFKPIWNALRTYRYPTMQVSDPSAAGAEETASTVGNATRLLGVCRQPAPIRRWVVDRPTCGWHRRRTGLVHVSAWPALADAEVLDSADVPTSWIVAGLRNDESDSCSDFSSQRFGKSGRDRDTLSIGW